MSSTTTVRTLSCGRSIERVFIADVFLVAGFRMNSSQSAGAASPAIDTLDEYHRRLGSVLALYRNVTLALNMPLDNETLYEDVADLAGLRIAFRVSVNLVPGSLNFVCIRWKLHLGRILVLTF